MKCYIGLIYFVICFIRAAILFCALSFPVWIYLVLALTPVVVPLITALIEDYIYRRENYDDDAIIIEIRH